MAERDVFADVGAAVVPRVLGLGDRRVESPTYGCFDRPYWHYRLSDFPSAWFQSSCHLLALAYVTEVPDGRFHKNGRVRDWSLAAARFLASLAHRDGSVDEAYPNEHSYCATAFAAYHLGETMLYLGEPLPPAATRMGEWLMSRRSDRAANQDAAAAAALTDFGLLTGRADFREAARERMELVLAQQAADGWFAEYGGYDVGYQTVTLSLLAKRCWRTGETQAGERLAAALAFLDGQVRADGTFAREGTSRQTQFLYPFGPAFFRHPLADRIGAGMARQSVLVPAWLDDRYVTPLAIDCLEAASCA